MGLAVGPAGISNELWLTALNALEPKYAKPVFEMWLKRMRLLEFNGAEIVLSVHTPFAKDWVENRLKTDIAAVLSDILGEPISLRFVVVEPSGEEPLEITAGRPFGPAEGRPGGPGQREGNRSKSRPAGLSAPPSVARASSTGAIHSKPSSSARATGSRTRLRRRWLRRPAAPTTRSSCTAAWVWGKRTSCTRSVTACFRQIPKLRSFTFRAKPSPTSSSTRSKTTRPMISGTVTATSTSC